jgi:MFS superfamily sulfate permease-like transporter
VGGSRCRPFSGWPNANAVKERVLALSAGARIVVLDLEVSVELDVQSADMLRELAGELRREGVELRLIRVHGPAHEILRRAGVTDQVPVESASR